MRQITNLYADEYIVRLPFGRIVLAGSLGIPPRAAGTVVFPNVGGSVRCNGRLHFLAREMRRQGYATLIVSLLSMEEEIVDLHANTLRFRIDLLANRLGGVLRWLAENALGENDDVCYFAFHTAAAAALAAAARRRCPVNSLVVCSARADLAGGVLSAVTAPVLDIVGANDFSLIDINRAALADVPALHRLVIMPGMERNAEKMPALREVARRAGRWFGRHRSAVRIRDGNDPVRQLGDLAEPALVNG
jgi:hypothetical protein